MDLIAITSQIQATDTDTLNALLAAIQAELSNRQTAHPIRVALHFGGYNERRYGRPWIGRITSWPVGGRPEIEWGRYIGDDSGGEAEIMAQPGDIVRWGQKDNRGNNTDNSWGIVEADGSIRSVEQPEARKHWQARQ